MRNNRPIPNPLPTTGFRVGKKYYRTIQDVLNDRRLPDDAEVVPLGVIADGMSLNAVKPDALKIV